MLILKRSVVILLLACLPLLLFSGCEAAAGYLLYDLISGGPIFGDGDGDDPPDPDVNHNPQITTLQAIPGSIAIGGQVTLTCLAIDEDGDPMTYLWQASMGQFTNSTSNVTLWTAPNDTTGLFQISITVSDGEGGMAVDLVEVQVTL